jgi:hypothetical protein
MKNIVNAWILKKIANEPAEVEQIKKNIETSISEIKNQLESKAVGSISYFLMHQTVQETALHIFEGGLKGAGPEITSTMSHATIKSIIEALRNMALVKLRNFKGYENQGFAHKGSNCLILALVTKITNPDFKIPDNHVELQIRPRTKIEDFLNEEALNNRLTLPAKYILGACVIEDSGKISLKFNPKFKG